MSAQVIVIGLDGATFRLLDPWMDAGELPNLRRIRDRGVSAPLESSMPPHTCPAWPCFMTGKHAPTLGIYGFFRGVANSYDEVPVDSHSLQGQTLWDELSRQGRSVAVLNVPITAPAWEINGVMVSDHLVPSQRHGFTWPPQLADEIERRFGPYRVTLRTPPVLLVHQSRQRLEGFLDECCEILDYKFDVAEWLMQRQHYDVLMLHVLESDRLQHWLWNLIDGEHPAHDPELAAQLHDRVVGYYRAVDARIGRLLDSARSDATVLVMSDHGFGPGYRAFVTATWLLREDYIAIRDRAVSRLRHWLWRHGWTPDLARRAVVGAYRRSAFVRRMLAGLAARRAGRAGRDRVRTLVQGRRRMRPFFLSYSDIDWRRTRAFCARGSGQIRVNLSGREPHGAVAPGTEYDRLLERMTTQLLELRDPVTGAPLGGRVQVNRQDAPGAAAPVFPDLTFDPLAGGASATNITDFAANRVFVEDIPATGIHRADGVLLAAGGPIQRAATAKDARLIDLAPTILHLAGCRIPRDMEGRVLDELLEPDWVARHPPAYESATAAVVEQDRAAALVDEARMLERLRGLGYVD